MPDCEIPEEMKMYKVKIGRNTVKVIKILLFITKTEKTLLYTPIIRLYLQHDLRLTEVHQLIEYKQVKSFSQIPKEVANARRKTDKDYFKKWITFQK